MSEPQPHPRCFLSHPLAIGVVVLCSLGCDRGQPEERSQAIPAKPIKIVVSGDTQGWIVPCGCTSNQSGGLPRRGRYVAELRQSNRVLLFDVGGAASGVAPYDRAKFEAILKGELLMETAAHNLGESELKLGVELLRNVATRLKAPFVSANTTDESDQPIVPPGLLVSLVSGEVLSTFLVVGVVSPRYATAGIRVSEPREAILRQAQAFAGQYRHLIVLAYLPEPELRDLAANLPEAELFSDSAPLIREMSMRALHKIGASNVQGALLRLLDDPNANVRAAVLNQLAESPSERVVPRIAEYVAQEQDVDLVGHGIRVLRGAKGTQAMESLMSLLSHADWHVRASATEAVGEKAQEQKASQSDAADAYLALIERLADDDGFVVSRAIASLAKSDLPIAVEPLVKVAGQRPELAAEVVNSISQGSQQFEKALPHLRAFCQHPNPHVGAAAITAVCGVACGVASVAAKDELLDGLMDPEPAPRIAAAAALVERLAKRAAQASPTDFDRPTDDEDPVATAQKARAEPPQPTVLGRLFGSLSKLFSNSSPDEEPASRVVDAEQAVRVVDIESETVMENADAAVDPADSDQTLRWIRERHGYAPWMFDTAALLHPMLLAESVDERVAAAVALAALGHDGVAIPALYELLGETSPPVAEVAKALRWLLWPERQRLFRRTSDVRVERTSSRGHAVPGSSRTGPRQDRRLSSARG